MVVVVINWCCLFAYSNDNFLLDFVFVVVAFVMFFFSFLQFLFATIIIRYFTYFSLSQTHVGIVKRNIASTAMPVVVFVFVGLVDAVADECALILMAFHDTMCRAVLCYAVL